MSEKLIKETQQICLCVSVCEYMHMCVCVSKQKSISKNSDALLINFLLHNRRWCSVSDRYCGQGHLGGNFNFWFNYRYSGGYTGITLSSSVHVSDCVHSVSPPLNHFFLFKRNLVLWCIILFIRSGQNYLARHSEKGKKTWQTETGLEFGRSQRAVENREKWLWSHLWYPTTLAVKG